MCNVLVRSFDAITSINWLEVIKALAPVATAVIAFFAFKNWGRQDKAKREAEFLVDAMIEAVHADVAEVTNPLEVLKSAKIGMKSHAPTWEDGNEADIAVKGAIAYIEKYGEHHAKHLLDELKAVQPSVIRLRSLAAKGQVFGFKDYARCHQAVAMLTWHFDRMQAFAAVIGSSGWDWKNSEALKHLKNMMAIDADGIENSLKENNVAILKFASDTYKRIYG